MGILLISSFSKFWAGTLSALISSLKKTNKQVKCLCRTSYVSSKCRTLNVADTEENNDRDDRQIQHIGCDAYEEARGI